MLFSIVLVPVMLTLLSSSSASMENGFFLVYYLEPRPVLTSPQLFPSESALFQLLLRHVPISIRPTLLKTSRKQL